MKYLPLQLFDDDSIRQLPLSPYIATEQPDMMLLKFIEQYMEPTITAEFIDYVKKITVKRFTDITQLAVALGCIALLAPRGLTCCPIITIEEHDGYMRLRVDLFAIDDMKIKHSPGTPYVYTPCYPYGNAGYNWRHILVGYDVEYIAINKEPEPGEEKGIITTGLKMVSHQFYFNFGLEHVCIVFITSRRLTQNAFIRQFLANALPDSAIVYEQNLSGRSVIKKVPITKVHVCSHFSLIESGLLLFSYDKVTTTDPKTGKETTFDKQVIECKKKQWIGKTRIRDRKHNVPVELWIDGQWITEAEYKRRNCKRRRKLERLPKNRLPAVQYASSKFGAVSLKSDNTPGVWAHFADSMNMVLGSLSKGGKIIGIGKHDVGEAISDMGSLWRDDPALFLEYSAMDAIITAQIIAYYARAFAPLTGGEMATRIAKYSEIHFKQFFQKLYSELETGEAVPVCVETGKQLRVRGQIWKPAMGFKELERFEDRDGLGLEVMIKDIVGDSEVEVYPTTMDELVDYVVAKQEQQGEL